MAWIQANWHQIATILLIVLTLLTKVPFVEHSTLAELAVKALGYLIGLSDGKPTPVGGPSSQNAGAGDESGISKLDSHSVPIDPHK